MIDRTKAAEEGKPEGAGKAEGVEKWQHAHQPVLFGSRKDLLYSFDIREDVVVGEHDSLWQASAPT